MKDREDFYNDTYPGMLTSWVARKAFLFKLPISKNPTLFADAQAKSVDNVIFLGMVSDNVVPTMEMTRHGCYVAFMLLFSILQVQDFSIIKRSL